MPLTQDADVIYATIDMFNLFRLWFEAIPRVFRTRRSLVLEIHPKTGVSVLR
jgi:hypothetical protein